ncbi:BMP family ABC transporter substrate-binding protein [Halothiobacillus sp.]|uniref:BMP family ABC transporter substrate-binding protein n=1 Tax=Halothiobacillus sp. TaxID=1891311 RepID=UPI00260D7EDC|nr:BMP family ABC transporter substrate-binding protein [Halothiobacillus sp.]
MNMSTIDKSRRKALAQLGGSAAALTLISLGIRTASASEKLTIGAVYVGSRDDYGYNQSHAEAVAEMKKLPYIRVVEEERVPETIAVQKSMQAMIEQDDAKLIFATSFGYFDPYVLKLGAQYPKIRFAHCGGLWTPKDPKNTGSFFGYIDECEYLSGVVAAHVSKSKKLGFIAAKPIPQVLRNINSFTLGAQSVDPSFTTHVIFTGDWSMPVKEAESANSLIDQGCDVITCHVDSPKVIIETAEKRGVYCTGYHVDQSSLAPKGYLTGAEWVWATPYKMLVDAAYEGKPMLNFLRGGLKEGFVKMSPYGKAVPEKAKETADAIKAKMLGGSYVIFKGPLKDNNGKTVIPEGVSLGQRDVALEGMNYLVAGVVGQI